MTIQSQSVCSKIFFTITIFIISFLYFFKAESGESWTYCYNKSSNRIYFLEMKELKKNKNSCQGRTYFQGYKNYHLIQDSVDEKGFSRNEQGTAMKMNLKNGRSILVTQWNNLTKTNMIIVLEPDHKNKKTKKHCEIENFSDEFKAKVSKKTGKFILNVNKPVTEFSEKFHRVWKECSLK